MTSSASAVEGARAPPLSFSPDLPDLSGNIFHCPAELTDETTVPNSVFVLGFYDMEDKHREEQLKTTKSNLDSLGIRSTVIFSDRVRTEDLERTFAHHLKGGKEGGVTIILCGDGDNDPDSREHLLCTTLPSKDTWDVRTGDLIDHLGRQWTEHQAGGEEAVDPVASSPYDAVLIGEEQQEEDLDFNSTRARIIHSATPSILQRCKDRLWSCSSWAMRVFGLVEDDVPAGQRTPRLSVLLSGENMRAALDCVRWLPVGSTIIDLDTDTGLHELLNKLASSPSKKNSCDFSAGSLFLSLLTSGMPMPDYWKPEYSVAAFESYGAPGTSEMEVGDLEMDPADSTILAGIADRKVRARGVSGISEAWMDYIASQIRSGLALSEADKGAVLIMVNTDRFATSWWPVVKACIG
ncbi:uncharacterized protein MKK02DRAFT_41243 [Dioszegia hungarica]|uniref:Uncharacterized protein n=1 Tax=Dioszegia hungarica TaxID=4972 RepID=A0AA38LS29_9TREE|nr:uncharacterized protein MKK02DRAFT_41243 [Dioszegia hungarica]KAI9632099.1 hypothetical protein MKK02DRAFT_41243 [Dioszegia hungarica]